MWNRYRTQSVFVLLQSVLVIYGVIGHGVIMKMNGYPEWDRFSTLAMAVRHGGFLLLLVPAIWVALTLWYERVDRNFPRLFAVVTGAAVLVLLHIIFREAATGAQRKMFIQGFDDF